MACRRRSPARRAASVPRSAPTHGFPGAGPRRPGARCGARERRRAHGAVGGHHAAPEDRVPRPPSAHRAARRLRRATSSTGKTRSGVVKINLALAELPNFTADPSSGHGRAPHRLGRDGAVDGVHRGRVPGRPRRQARAAAVQRRRHPDDAGQDAESRWHAHHVAVHPVGARRLGGRAAHRGTRRLRRPA